MLPLDAQSAEKTTFGPFELNCRTSELFKNGKRVRLSGQSAHLLVILVQRANQLVSREDLRLALWSEDTYVDFDCGLNNCISRVREALGDSAAVPRYIQTLPKQGYRFIAEIHDSRPASSVVMDVVPEGRLEPVALSTSSRPFSAAWRCGKSWGILAIVSSVLLTGIGMVWQLWQRDYFWHNPLDGAKVQRLTDFEGDELDAAISEDGKFAIFSSDRSGQPEVWLTEIGSSDFENVTKGSVPRLVFNNGTVRRAGFSGDGSQVWATEQASIHPIKEKTWIGPAIGGAFHPFLEEGLEPAWSPDGRRIVYHTPDAGDPIFIADQNGGDARQIFRQQAGVHCHFLTWSPDGRYIYFASGTPTTEEMDIWRISASTHAPVAERITHNKTRVAYLGWLNTRTLIYSATAEDGPGQWLYSMDVEHRIPHRVSFGIEDEYLSASVSETHPRRLVASVARPGASLWTIPLSNRMEPEASAVRLPVPNTSALGPRFGDGYLLFLAGGGVGDGLWRLDGGSARELWKGNEGGLVAPPAIAPGSGQICFSFRKEGRARLNIMSGDGINVRTLAPSLDVRSGVSWSPDGKWIVVAGDRGDGTHVFKVPVDGGEPVQLLHTLSYNPVWSPDGKLIVYSEQQGGSRFVLKAITRDGVTADIPDISVVYTKATSYRFLPGRNALVALEGDFRKQNFYRVDLTTGEQRRLTDLQPGYRVQDFDVSPDGREIVFDRFRDNADVVLLELAK